MDANCWLLWKSCITLYLQALRVPMGNMRGINALYLAGDAVADTLSGIGSFLSRFATFRSGSS